jgi:hypothetical protein
VQLLGAVGFGVACHRAVGLPALSRT